SRPSKTQLTNLHGSSITSSRLDSLMTKLSLQNLKLATNSIDFINFKPSQSKWVIPLWRRMPETQFLERGAGNSYMTRKRIVIVDDEPNIGRSLQLILDREGYAVSI